MRTACIAFVLGCCGVAAIAAAAPPLAWAPVVEVASGRGERGPWRQSESRFDYVDDPTVAVDAQGGAAVAWVDQARKAVLFQRCAADGQPRFAAPVDVSRHPGTFSWLPRIALAPDGRVFIAWQEIIFSGGSHGGEILVASSADGGRTFAEPVNLSDSVAGDGKGRITARHWHNGSLDIVAAANGAVHVAWTEYEGALWTRRSEGAGFSMPVRVAGDRARPARGPALAAGPDGTVHLAWTVGEDPGADIHFASSRDGGASFGPVRRIAPGKAYSDAPKLAIDRAGTVHLAWAESAGGPFDRFHIRYARSTDGGRTFGPARELSSPLPAGAASASFPGLAVDGQGRVYVSWELSADARQPPRGLGLAVSTDGGATFGAPQAVPGSTDASGGHNGSGQGLLMKKLAVNGDGALALANSAFKPGSHSRVWLMRGRLPR